MTEEITNTEAAEAVESSRAMVEAERVMPADFAHNAALHFAKAVRKHPRFADSLWNWTGRSYAEDELAKWRRILKIDDKAGVLSAQNLLYCEILEAAAAHNAQKNEETISELYDAVAVLMRMIAVVEGKQKLGGER